MTERMRPTKTQATAASNVPPASRVGLSSGGQALDRHTQATMSARFGHDFSQVRIHTDTRAEESADAFGAHAFAQGNDIVFGAGRYTPGSPETDRLLAHELTHVAQQAQFGPASDPTGLSQRGDAAEREADSLASQVMMGRSVQVGAAPTAILHCYRPPQAGDEQWTDKRNSDMVSAGIRGVQGIPGIGNILSAATAGASLGVAGYDAITGDSKGAASALRTSEDFALDSIPVVGNLRALFQAGTDLGAVRNDYNGMDPKKNPNSIQREQSEMNDLNTGIGDLLSGGLTPGLGGLLPAFPDTGGPSLGSSNSSEPARTGVGGILSGLTSDLLPNVSGLFG